MPAKPLTPEQLADAARLKDAFDRAKERNPALTQAQLAYECGWGTQGTVSQYLLGKIPLNLDALLKFCSVLHVNPSLISPTLSDRLHKAHFSFVSTELNEEQALYGDPAAYEYGRTPPRKGPGKLNVQTIDIPCLKLRTVAGKLQPEMDQAVERMTVNVAWLKRHVSFNTPSKLALITASGDNMGDTFGDGDVLLIDRSINAALQDAVYIVSLENNLYIRRLQRLPDGGMLMISDNKKYEPYRVKADEVDGFNVLGRVLLAWNARKL